MVNKDLYLEGKGRFCPYCIKPTVEGHSVETGSGDAVQEMSCQTCGKSWYDIYKLIDLEPREHNGEVA